MNTKSVVPVETRRVVTGREANPFWLPAGVTTNNITAEIANGVLKVTVQKPTSKQAKQIEFKSAA